MEDAVDALKLGASVLAFVIGLSIVFVMFAQAREVSDFVLQRTDNTYFVDYEEAKDEDLARTVGIESIIPSLYRYYNEKLVIDIKNKESNDLDTTTNDYIESIIEKFDTNSQWNNENIFRTESYQRWTDTSKISEYEKKKDAWYPDGVVWRANKDIDAQTRVTAFISGSKKNGEEYIVNEYKLSNYKKSGENLKSYRNELFTENFREESESKTRTAEDGSVIYLSKGSIVLYLTYTLK